ncbi:hypothetical protein H9Q08_06245 [Chryseobacterium sp. PS-8]|uniref:Lipoprotein n=1 Tax=Chryseobacterium indicum TaxID=2766954 RepID=A0ABS9C2X7_9FLAO|nr:hypothetical protein [Chryseobacterium sp. PS-8]MCF2218897.1 hypothetical protein [Chryseobacterium sp. PS-8]
MKKLYSILLLILIISCKKKQEGTYVGGYYWIYGYGLIDMRREEAIEGISEKWKIKYVDIGGCTVSSDIEKKADSLNKKTYAEITRRYGKNWKKKYDEDIEAFMMKKVEVMDVLITNTFFRNELKKYPIEIDDLDKDVKELKNDLYKVVIYNQKLKSENKECFTVNVDTKNRTVNLIK